MITSAARELQSAAGQRSEPGAAHGRLERRRGPARLTRVCATDLGLAKEQAVPTASTAETKKETPPGRRKKQQPLSSPMCNNQPWPRGGSMIRENPGPMISGNHRRSIPQYSRIGSSFLKAAFLAACRSQHRA